MDINVEMKIEELEKEIKQLEEKEEKTLTHLNKISMLKEELAELTKEREEKLYNALESAKDLMTDNSTFAESIQPYLDELSSIYFEVESGIYKPSFIMQLEKQAEQLLEQVFDLHREDMKNKQKALNKLYNRYNLAVTTRAKDVTTTEAFLIKEEVSVMSNEELREFQANNRKNEVIKRLALAEMKRRGLAELPDISPIAKLQEKWGQGVNADTLARSNFGITVFKPSLEGVEPMGLTRSELKNVIKKLNKDKPTPQVVTLHDLLDNRKEKKEIVFEDTL